MGDLYFWGLFFDDPLDPVVGVDSLGIVRDRNEDVFLARIKPGDSGGFSVPILSSVSGVEVWFSLRLFELSSASDEFLMYRSGAVELALSNPNTPRTSVSMMQDFAGNGGATPYLEGGFGIPIGKGGKGVAELRFSETLAHLQDQIIAQARVVLREDYELIVLYSPVIDDSAHLLVGHLDPSFPEYDSELASIVWDRIADSFKLQDRFLGILMDAAAKENAHLILVSDHGISATNRLINVNIALMQAGFLSLNPDRSIDLEATQALMPPLSDGSIAINTLDRAGGIVSSKDRETVLMAVRKALAEMKDPETKERLITAFYEPMTNGLLQPGGESTGDLFLEFAKGYYPSSATAVNSVVQRIEPRGNHVYVPTRRDMMAIFGAWGPRVRPNYRFGKVRAIDVVPTVMDLLGLPHAAELPGRSLLKTNTLLKSR